MKARWFDDPSNVLTLVIYLATEYPGEWDLSYVAEKPWKFEDEFLEAVHELVGGEAETDETE